MNFTLPAFNNSLILAPSSRIDIKRLLRAPQDVSLIMNLFWSVLFVSNVLFTALLARSNSRPTYFPSESYKRTSTILYRFWCGTTSLPPERDHVWEFELDRKGSHFPPVFCEGLVMHSHLYIIFSLFCADRILSSISMDVIWRGREFNCGESSPDLLY